MSDPTVNNSAVPESTNALLLKANAAMNRERYDQAVAWCQQILEQNSDEVNALKLLSLSLWKQGQLNSAVLQASYFWNSIRKMPMPIILWVRCCMN